MMREMKKGGTNGLRNGGYDGTDCACQNPFPGTEENEEQKSLLSAIMNPKNHSGGFFSKKTGKMTISSFHKSGIVLFYFVML